MKSLKFSTYQYQSVGYCSLQLDIAYSKDLLDDETEVSNAIQLGIDAIQRHLSKSVIRSSSSRQNGKQRERYKEERTDRNQMDQVLEQILCEGSHLSTV